MMEVPVFKETDVMLCASYMIMSEGGRESVETKVYAET